MEPPFAAACGSGHVSGAPGTIGAAAGALHIWVGVLAALRLLLVLLHMLLLLCCCYCCCCCCCCRCPVDQHVAAACPHSTPPPPSSGPPPAPTHFLPFFSSAPAGAKCWKISAWRSRNCRRFCVRAACMQQQRQQQGGPRVTHAAEHVWCCRARSLCTAGVAVATDE